MTVARPSRTLLVFARNPVPGEVKTRLAAGIGSVAAAAVYERLLDTALCAASGLSDTEVTVCIANRAPNDGMLARLHDHGYTWHAQAAGDLGIRMHSAFSHALRSTQRVVLIGSDCPEFTPDYLCSAFDALDHDDVVLGPARDGGYVLIGMRRLVADAFSDVPWGHDSVLAVTRQRLRAAGVAWCELPVLQDIDSVADLDRFPQLTKGLATDA